MERIRSHYGYPYTPIRIEDGTALAWVWDGRERFGREQLPVFRLKKPKKGMWRNGRVLSIPFRSEYVTTR